MNGSESAPLYQVLQFELRHIDSPIACPPEKHTDLVVFISYQRVRLGPGQQRVGALRDYGPRPATTRAMSAGTVRW